MLEQLHQHHGWAGVTGKKDWATWHRLVPRACSYVHAPHLLRAKVACIMPSVMQIGIESRDLFTRASEAGVHKRVDWCISLWVPTIVGSPSRYSLRDAHQKSPHFERQVTSLFL